MKNDQRYWQLKMVNKESGTVIMFSKTSGLPPNKFSVFPWQDYYIITSLYWRKKKVGEAKGERAIQSICLIASDGSASELRIQEVKLKMMKRV